MAVVMSVSSLSRVNESGIRRKIVEDGLIEAVLLLPSRTFYSTSVLTLCGCCGRAGSGKPICC
ncbi:MAG: N-6 DNA methylase [Oscillibacter sp.]|nr:N-6 DNA methylase [Oscillibacter sp.]